MDFSGGKMMETGEDPPFSLNVVKEERLDFEEEEKKGETSRRGRTRSLTKKSADKVDIKAKLGKAKERSRQSARECRARKKLRYQYLEEIISETEKAIGALRREMEYIKVWAKELDEGRVPPSLIEYRRAHLERRAPETFKFHTTADVLMEEQQGPEILRHVQQASTSPASSGIASASTSAGTATMAFSPTSSAFAAMMLNPSSLTHTISPS